VPVLVAVVTVTLGLRLLHRLGLAGCLAGGVAFMILFGNGQPESSDVIAALIASAAIRVGVRGLQSRWDGSSRAGS
jgi:hypothetical protein